MTDMTSKTIVVTNEVGLHARAASHFIKCTNSYKSSVWIERDGKRVNAKSLLGVLSLGVTKDTEIEIIADGADEKICIDELAAVIESGFAQTK